jgi:hypothetical protein
MCNYGINRCYLIRNNYANISLKKLDDRVIAGKVTLNSIERL